MHPVKFSYKILPYRKIPQAQIYNSISQLRPFENLCAALPRKSIFKKEEIRDTIEHEKGREGRIFGESRDRGSV